MKEFGSEVAGQAESSQPTQPKTPNPFVKSGRLVSTEPPSRSNAQEIDKRFLLGCESTKVSVERSDIDKRRRRKRRRRSSKNGGDTLEVNNLPIYSHNVRR